jgi:hypothetical protein
MSNIEITKNDHLTVTRERRNRDLMMAKANVSLYKKQMYSITTSFAL